ncbi:MAG: ASCH domain-containing protein [Patescibacteria group bacterium]|nr:ASCH domain-containing protein [Patescibacteria group bacterium]
MEGLIVKQPYASLIIEGEKEWEIRSRSPPKDKINKEVLLLSSGFALGKVKITNFWESDANNLINNKSKHLSNTESLENNETVHVWQLNVTEKFLNPKKYNHPMGARVWINEVDFNNQQKILQFIY